LQVSTRKAPNCFVYRRQARIISRSGVGNIERQLAVPLPAKNALQKIWDCVAVCPKSAFNTWKFLWFLACVFLERGNSPIFQLFKVVLIIVLSGSSTYSRDVHFVW